MKRQIIEILDVIINLSNLIIKPKLFGKKWPRLLKAKAIDIEKEEETNPGKKLRLREMEDWIMTRHYNLSKDSDFSTVTLIGEVASKDFSIFYPETL
ncbi:MAG: hypothetical protein JSV56_04040 [Methanomassiliicoccales archaeon]|nr:MAG: hypothetical protein JSV56_04040 [Methanomassiliicoccales archaeon]